MRLVFLFGLIFYTYFLFAQNGKSQRLYEKAEESIKARNFKLAKEQYQKSIKADETNSKAYIRLAYIYNIYRVKDSALLYYEGYTRVTPIHKINAKIWLKIAELNYQLGNYKIASDAMLKLRPFGNRTEFMDRLEKNINFSLKQIEESKKLDIEELSSDINQFQLQYFPVMTVDGKYIFYTKRNGATREFDEDIVFSHLVNGKWSKSTSISKNINTPYNEGACTISADGRTLIFTACEGERKIYGSCDLFISYKEGEIWSVPENMGQPINTKHWDSQPALSGDGRTLYFSSDRPGGYGKRDIWVSTYNGSAWMKPINAGEKVNSMFDETTPYIHVNNQTLFFSSTGYDNLGGFDLFFTNKETNNAWSYPENLGYPINTHHDELSFFINAEGSKAYYAIENQSTSGGVSRLVSLNYDNESLIPSATYVTGVVRDEITQKPLKAELEMINLIDSLDTYITTSDSLSGRYFLVLREGTDFGVFIDKEGYLFEDVKFLARSKSINKPDTLDISLMPLNTGRSIVLENIYFDFDDYTLDQRSRSELHSIIKYMKKNKSLRFLIEGHTDQKGNADYNLKLSEKRALAVYQYLINRGIRKDRLDFKGFGSAKPLEKGTQNDNRRIEFRLL